MRCPIDGVKTFAPPSYPDDRGSFTAVLASRYHTSQLPEISAWREVNLSRSDAGVIRGLHLQHPAAQSKFVTVIDGSIWDVVVDFRPDSPTYLHFCYYVLSADGPRSQIFVPAGCAHGFATPDTAASVLYLTDAPWTPEHEITLAHDDSTLSIPWPVDQPSLSGKDRAGLALPDVCRLLGQRI